MPDQSVATAVYQALADVLQNKMSTLSNSSATVAVGSTANGGVASTKKTQVTSSATFSLRISFAELYEETITDLLAVASKDNNDRKALLIEDDPALGKTIKNLTWSAPLTSLTDFRRLLDAGLHGRRSSNGLFGNLSEFSSASGSVVRLSEGPLLNKSLFALQDVVQSLSHSGADEVPVRYQGSQLTTLLQDALGGNCLTLVLMCVSPGDVTGSTATFQLSRMLPRICTFPVVNNDMLRGLRYRQFMAQKHVASNPVVVAAKDGSLDGKQGLADYEHRLHDLEGKLAQNVLERRILREDKSALTAQLGELRAKYRELFDNELALRNELLACEQEKLALSEAFVAFQLERDTQVQQLDSDKFEVETRLLQAEQLVVEIQQDDTTKAAQIQDLCDKMNELVSEKARLGNELTMLQKAAKDADSARGTEAKRNQQLSLELIVAVNQKQKFQGEMETLATRLRSCQSQVEAQTTACTHLRSENDELRQKVVELEEKIDLMRKDVVRRELELERAELAIKKEKFETQQAGRDADSKREISVKQLSNELESQRATFEADKRSLELLLERVRSDLAREIREKQHTLASLKTKTEENEELLLSLERARHDVQAQLETFRLKLALLQQSSTTGDEPSTGIRVLRELLSSYQIRERELRDELSSARNMNLRLARRLRAPNQDTLESPPNNESEGDRDIGGEVIAYETDEIKQMRGRLASMEQHATSEMEQRAEQALRLAELEGENANLVRQLKEKQQLHQVSPARDDQSGTRAVAEMHASLAHQLEEVRQLTLQLQHQQRQQNEKMRRITDTAPPPSQTQSSTANPLDSHEVESLRVAKEQLESRLSNNKTQWMALLEQVERRCAELLTKNVMLTEENENLRQHILKAHKKAAEK
ncbi:unnamed protein product [Phytophthora fragariaefolia]|uniref:Unnamed protein product n=1 Tax=Phytophthora fragariaefolia TaxID=1490495 RepID=A0A9W6UB99_9STRA|nr:unnamed protein product [Phytophthora fragariaefolia]